MKNNNILILTYWSYNDPLISTYTLPYVRIIRRIVPAENKIYLVTYENKLYKISKNEKIVIKKKLQNEGITWVHFSYSKLGPMALIKVSASIFALLFIVLYRKLNVIHAWCTPAGSLGYIISKITGAELVLDSFEPHAESMVESGVWKKEGIAYKLLLYFEKLQANRAKVAVVTVTKMSHYAIEKYGCKNLQFHTKPSCTDQTVFNKVLYKNEAKPAILENKIVCVYAGKIGGIYLEQEIFDFIKVASEYWKDRFIGLFLTNTDSRHIELLAVKSGLNPAYIYTKHVIHSEMPKYLSMADFAINPVKPITTKRYCTSIKDGEYWAMGLPVIITKNISDDSEIIDENEIGYVLKELSNSEYINAVKKIDWLISNNNRESTEKKIVEIANRYRNFRIAVGVYNQIYTSSY